MPDITIPSTAHIVFGKHWGGWTWITKNHKLQIIRYLAYRQEGEDILRSVFFLSEKDYEQFKDELDFFNHKGEVWTH